MPLASARAAASDVRWQRGPGSHVACHRALSLQCMTQLFHGQLLRTFERALCTLVRALDRSLREVQPRGLQHVQKKKKKKKKKNLVCESCLTHRASASLPKEEQGVDFERRSQRASGARFDLGTSATQRRPLDHCGHSYSPLNKQVLMYKLST